MKAKTLLVVVLLLIFVLVSASIAQAQTDPEFQNLLTRLNGAQWLIAQDNKAKVWLELQGNTLSYYQYGIDFGTSKAWSVNLVKRKFVFNTAYWGGIGEISEDGDVITIETTFHRDFPQFVGKVEKAIRIK
jgi:predicted membrane-bound dolichyl-phosphate-mannose-protein mannosyltransferase